MEKVMAAEEVSSNGHFKLSMHGPNLGSDPKPHGPQRDAPL